MPLLPEGSRQKSLFALALEVRINECGGAGVEGHNNAHTYVSASGPIDAACALTKHVESGLHYKEV